MPWEWMTKFLDTAFGTVIDDVCDMIFSSTLNLIRLHPLTFMN